jgi:hypothetical protein
MSILRQSYDKSQHRLKRRRLNCFNLEIGCYLLFSNSIEGQAIRIDREELDHCIELFTRNCIHHRQWNNSDNGIILNN